MRLICELCDCDVWQATKQDGQGAGSIWVCYDCNVKYPLTKKKEERNDKVTRKPKEEEHHTRTGQDANAKNI